MPGLPVDLLTFAAELDPNDYYDLEVGDQAQQVSNYIEAHPETREQTERAKRHFAHVISKLDNPGHEVGIPSGWTITNASEYRGAFARAVIEGQLESDRKNNNVSLASMIGISEGSITTTLARAGIVNRPRTADVLINAPNMTPDEVRRRIQRFRADKYQAVPNGEGGSETGFARRFVIDGKEYTIVKDSDSRMEFKYPAMTWDAAVIAIERGAQVSINFQLASEQIIKTTGQPLAETIKANAAAKRAAAADRAAKRAAPVEENITIEDQTGKTTEPISRPAPPPVPLAIQRSTPTSQWLGKMAKVVTYLAATTPVQNTIGVKYG